MLAPEKFVITSASGHNATVPIKLMARLMLNVVDLSEYFLTRTTENAEVTEDNMAKATPSMMP